MPTNTPIYGFILPSINDPVDEDVWGGYLNSNFTKTENLLKTSINSVVNNISSAYTIQASDINKSILADATASAFNINLLPAATAGDGYSITFIKIDNSVNAVTILPNGVEKISGQSSYVLSASGSTVTIVSDGVSNWYTITGVGDASQSSKGIVQLASNAEVSAGTNTTKAVTPSGLISTFAKSLVNEGYQKLPGGLIIQWGITTVREQNAGDTETFPIAFPNNCFQVVFAITNTSATAHAPAAITSVSKTGFVWLNGGGAGGVQRGLRYIAIGN